MSSRAMSVSTGPSESTPQIARIPGLGDRLLVRHDDQHLERRL
jgi:hypothetical protein